VYAINIILDRQVKNCWCNGTSTPYTLSTLPEVMTTTDPANTTYQSLAG